MFQKINQLKPLAKLGIGTAIVVLLLVIGYKFGGAGINGQKNQSTISQSDAEVCLKAGGTIYFNVTYGSDTYLKKIGFWEQAQSKLKYSQAFVFNASTHVGTIQDLDIEGKVFLRYDGILYPTVGEAFASTTHHNTWLIFLPKFDMVGDPIFDQAEGQFEIIIDGVDIPEHRVFTFLLPLPIAGGQNLDFTRILMILGATMAAMLLTCTPCLVGSLTVGSLAMGSAWGAGSENPSEEIRKNLIKQTSYYLLALVLSYAAVAVAASAFKITLEDIRPIEVMGGVLLMIVGVTFLREWKPMVWIENQGAKLLVKAIPSFSKFVTDDAPDQGLESNSSTAMGASLAMVCSVAGAPTLTTAIILPVVIFAGLNDIYWSLAILFIYLVITALPFFLISVGLGEYLLSLSFAVRKKLMIANAFVLIALGTMLIVSPEAMAGILSAPARMIIEPLSYLF